MRSKQTINVAINRQRYTAKGYISKPKTYDNLANIPQQLKETNNGCPFLVLNDTVIAEDSSPNAKQILVFLSQHGKEMQQLVCGLNIQVSCQHTFSSIN
jgi:hypothetical protein